MTDALRQELVDAHNNFRRGVNPPATDMIKMTWDSDLEFLATKWAENCEFGHDSGSARKVPQSFSSGQNGFAGGRLGNMTAVVNAWHSEVKDYTYGSDGNVFHKVGHYTQVVWAKSYKVGCGGAICGGTGHFYCNYGPPGNYGIKTPYKTGTRGSDCLKNDGGICDCGNIHCNSGSLDPKTCKCTCDPTTTYGPYCKWSGAKCEDSMGTSTCDSYATQNGGKEKFCKGVYKGWAKSKCFKYCDHCCENRIGTWQCENYAAHNTKHAICEGRYKVWGKDKCYKMCGHC